MVDGTIMLTGQFEVRVPMPALMFPHCPDPSMHLTGRRKIKPNVLLIMVLFTAGSANAEVLNFTAAIDGAQAANCAGTGSAGTGTGTLTLDTVTNEVNYNISFSGPTGSETISHVHGPAAECSCIWSSIGKPQDWQHHPHALPGQRHGRWIALCQHTLNR
ncbi:MAG: CHRD domain-containing protein [Planctomycetota bacterium]